MKRSRMEFEDGVQGAADLGDQQISSGSGTQRHLPLVVNVLGNHTPPIVVAPAQAEPSGSAAQNTMDSATPMEVATSSGIRSVSRILCPVIGCPEALSSSNRHFRDFTSIRNHLNDHCTGQISGAVPTDFLNSHSFSQCKECGKILHT